MYIEQQACFLSKLKEHEFRQYADNTGYLARQWLSAIPYNQFTTLSSQDIAGGLSYRTLIPGHNTVCRHCASANILGHDDNCSRREHLYIERHEYVKKIIAFALTTIDGTDVQTETKLRDSDRTSLRTDLKVTGPGSFNAASTEYDVAIISIHAQAHARVISNNLASNADLKSAENAIRTALDTKAQQKITKYASVVQVPFHPIILSVGGGSLSQDTHKLFKFWSDKMNFTVYKNMLRDLSISLLRARARPFLV